MSASKARNAKRELKANPVTIEDQDRQRQEFIAGARVGIDALVEATKGFKERLQLARKSGFQAGFLVGIEAAIKVLGIKPTGKRGAPKKVLVPERALKVYVWVERRRLASGDSATAACKWLAGHPDEPSYRTLLREYQAARKQFNAAGKTAQSVTEKDFITLSLLLENAKRRRLTANDLGLQGEQAEWRENQFPSRLPSPPTRGRRDKN